MAFMNSVMLGTRANNVKPKNFSSMATFSMTKSTVCTRISAMIEYSNVQPNSTE